MHVCFVANTHRSCNTFRLAIGNHEAKDNKWDASLPMLGLDHDAFPHSGAIILSGAHPTDDIAIEFEIRLKLEAL